MSMKKYFSEFHTFLTTHFFVWVIIPLFRRSIPLDSIEALMWGKYCDFGTNKHPPLSGFVAEGFYRLFGETNLGIYVASQVCILLGFIYIYKLAGLFLSKEKAVLSAMLLEGVIYYGFSSMEFNVNVLSLALWPVTVYYFYRAMNENKLSFWALTGVFAALNIWNKYVGGILLIAMALYLLLTAEGRAQFKHFGPYLTFMIFIVLLLPHLWWLYEHDFYVLEYFAGRSSSAVKTGLGSIVAAHLLYPLKFAGAQVLFCLLSLIVYFTAFRKAGKSAQNISASDKKFLIFTGVVPLLLMIFVSFAGGVKMKSMWGFPTLYMLGILLFVYFPFKLNDTLAAQMRRNVYVAMFLLAAAALAIIFFNKSEKINFPNKEFAADMTRLWNERYAQKMAYAGGEIWYIANVSLYGEDHAKPMAGLRPEINPWFDAGDFAEKGALVIFNDAGAYDNMRKRYSNLSPRQEYLLEFKNRIGKVKKKTIYYGFLEPQQGKNND